MNVKPTATPRALLQKVLNERQRRNPAYSLRAFSAALEVAPGVMSAILSGKRQLTRKLALRMVERLHLNATERAQFLAQSVVPPDGKKWRAPVTDYELVPAERFAPVSQWFYFAILGLSLLDRNEASAGWIAQRLAIPEAEAQRAFTQLVELGWIVLFEDGSFGPGSSPVWTEGAGLNLNIQRFHLQVMERAAAALKSCPPPERDFSAITIATTRSRIAEAREELRRFVRQLSAQLEAGPREDLYFLAVQFFPVSEAPATFEGRKH